jgi:hypothetical protein
VIEFSLLSEQTVCAYMLQVGASHAPRVQPGGDYTLETPGRRLDAAIRLLPQVHMASRV